MRAALSVASECVPLVKTGGLADVVGALPKAMAAEGWALRTLLPGYPAVLKWVSKGKVLTQWEDLFGGHAELISARAAGLDLLVLKAPHLFDRAGGIYLREDGKDWPDNPERFAALAWVGAEICAGLLPDWQPELVHVHDWQAALVPTYLAARDLNMASLITVHNIAFHGLAAAEKLAALRLPAERFHAEGFEFWGNISFLKAGLMDAHAINTVSPTYAEELLMPEFGMGLEGVIARRRGALHGILNGIDTDVWDPRSDTEIRAFVRPQGKAKNKAALVAEFGLDPEAHGPLCIVVSRLTAQKGLDLLLPALPRLLERGGQLALLGSGDPALEAGFRQAAEHPRVGVLIGYDEALSHRMFAGADAILIPSRFEPCGLTQLYGLRYGAIPVVARTGGLADTVIDANEAALRVGAANGLQFHPVTTDALARSLTRLCDLYAQPKVWAGMQRRAMAQPVGWDKAAAQYAALYTQLAG